MIELFKCLTARENPSRSKMKTCWVTGDRVSLVFNLIKARDVSTIFMVKFKKSSLPAPFNIPLTSALPKGITHTGEPSLSYPANPPG